MKWYYAGQTAEEVEILREPDTLLRYITLFILFK
jgi:hypothetical protein